MFHEHLDGVEKRFFLFFFFFQPVHELEQFAGGKRFSHVNIAENRTMISNKIHAEFSWKLKKTEIFLWSLFDENSVFPSFEIGDEEKVAKNIFFPSVASSGILGRSWENRPLVISCMLTNLWMAYLNVAKGDGQPSPAHDI